MGSSEGQTYCLRWNNHKSNLVEILDALIKMESYVDCTIYVDDQIQFKAHRVVLAANSPYFQSILQDVPMDHCSILFPGVKSFEMRALLEYMYTGEVNVTQSQIPRIMKIAEQLEVKGLFDMTDLRDIKDDTTSTTTTTTGTGTSSAQHLQQQQEQQQNNHYGHNNNSTKGNHHINNHHHNNNHHTNNNNNNNNINNNSNNNQNQLHNITNNNNNNNINHQSSTSPIISTSTNIIAGQQQNNSISPPITYHHNYKSPYTNLYSRSPIPSVSDRLPQWPQHLPSPLPTTQHLHNAAAAMLSSVYETGSDMNPLKRKKLSSISSMLMSRDTPILRNVLAQTNIADSSQTVPLICQNIGNNDRSDRQSTHSNGTDYSDKKNKYEEPHSPYTDKSFEDDTMETQSQSFSGSDSRIASYVPQQKPEWKRYKQYTRNDILSAIECVRNGMSALQASRKFGVPSRTLYDKVKKLGITTGRPMNRGMKRSPSHGSSPAGFPYGISGTSSPYSLHSQENPSQSQLQVDMNERNERDSRERDHLPPTIPHSAAALLDATFLQQALEARGGDIAGRDALHAMAFAAAAHAAVNGISTSPGTHGTARSPSPGILMKYMRPSTPIDEQTDKDDEDCVEDLSMGNKKKIEQQINIPQISPPSISPLQLQLPSSPPITQQQLPQLHQQQQQQGVIMPPMTKVPPIKEEFKEIKREITTEDDSRD